MGIAHVWRAERGTFVAAMLMSALFTLWGWLSAAAQEVLVNTNTEGFQHQPALTSIFSTEQFVAVWADRKTASIRAQRLAEDGGKRGAEILVNTSVADNTERIIPAVVSVPKGFVVAWIEKALNESRAWSTAASWSPGSVQGVTGVSAPNDSGPTVRRTALSAR